VALTDDAALEVKAIVTTTKTEGSARIVNGIGQLAAAMRIAATVGEPFWIARRCTIRQGPNCVSSSAVHISIVLLRDAGDGETNSILAQRLAQDLSGEGGRT
jgi:hypothetical protein